jgi:hypothetical protein
MTCYVDDACMPYGRMKMCHMVADTLDELHAMADRIGIKRKWFQVGAREPHYDICLAKRALAIEAGAVEVSTRQLVEILRGYRERRGTSRHAPVGG